MSNRLRPIIKIRFREDSKEFFVCLLDSGADFSTFPLSLGLKNNIDFSDEEPINAPEQITG